MTTALELFGEVERRAPSRLSTRPLPGLRFVPGMAVEPGITDQRPGEPGHEGAQALDPPHWRACEDWLFGVDLYNRAFWWEAHEAWEGPWLLAPRGAPARGLLQGLIQVAAGHLKLLHGGVRVAAQLWRRGSEHVQRAGEASGAERFLGLLWRPWLTGAGRYAEDAAVLGHTRPGFPYLNLS